MKLIKNVLMLNVHKQRFFTKIPEFFNITHTHTHTYIYVYIYIYICMYLENTSHNIFQNKISHVFRKTSSLFLSFLQVLFLFRDC